MPTTKDCRWGVLFKDCLIFGETDRKVICYLRVLRIRLHLLQPVEFEFSFHAVFFEFGGDVAMRVPLLPLELLFLLLNLQVCLALGGARSRLDLLG